MPIIAYQSLNSNSSSTHDVSATNSQYFTRMTHNNYAQNTAPSFLSYPTCPSSVEPNVPVYGPAHLVSSAPVGHMAKNNHTGNQFQSMVMDKSRQTHQVLHRELHGSCDLFVYGELDGSHSDWQSMSENTGSWVGGSSMAKACNCFSAYSNNNIQVTCLSEGTGWIAFECDNIVIVFVHVPNAIATNSTNTQKFYQDIANQLSPKQIDLIMGDTNQPSADFTVNAVKSALNSNSFAYATPSGAISPADMYNIQLGGTNSTATKRYDVAVYNTQTIRVEGCIYLSQCAPTTSNNNSHSAAITDHMGIGVKVSRI